MTNNKRPRIGNSSGVGGTVDELVKEMFAEVADKDSLRSDIDKYLAMDVAALPNFNEDGSVAFYEVAGVMLGKQGLMRFMERLGK